MPNLSAHVLKTSSIAIYITDTNYWIILFYYVFIAVILFVTSLILLRFYFKMQKINNVNMSNQLKVHLFMCLLCSVWVCLYSLIQLLNLVEWITFPLKNQIFDWILGSGCTTSINIVSYSTFFLILDRILAISFFTIRINGNNRLYLQYGSIFILISLFVFYFLTIFIRSYNSTKDCSYACKLVGRLDDFYLIKVIVGSVNFCCGSYFAFLFFRHIKQITHREKRKSYVVLGILVTELLFTIIPAFCFVYFQDITIPVVQLRPWSLMTSTFSMDNFVTGLVYWRMHQQKTNIIQLANVTNATNSSKWTIKRVIPARLLATNTR